MIKGHRREIFFFFLFHATCDKPITMTATFQSAQEDIRYVHQNVRIYCAAVNPRQKQGHTPELPGVLFN